MLVTYVAPNRAWHYHYARSLAKDGVLRRFVCGSSRFHPRAELPELGNLLLRADHIQNFYLASLRFHLPALICEELTYLSKIWLDHRATWDARQSDAFLFYSGTGLHTLRTLKSQPTACVMEAVNCHVLVQERILREEHERLGLPLHGFHPREVRRRVREIKEADGIICPSTFARQSFLELGMDPARVKVVPYGMEGIAVMPPNKKRTGEVFRVLYVGQINIRKGLRYLFDAFAQFRHPSKELWIVGPRTEQSGIDDKTPPEGTRFLGILKGEELAAAYDQCHAFVLPTIEDGFGLVLGEALAHGLPVIATVNSGAPDIPPPYGEVHLVPIRDPGAIAEKLQLLADRAEPPAPVVFQRRTWDDAGQELIDALRELTQLPKAGT